MKGQVLGFDGDTGAITGEDGQRYRFSKTDWKDERPPAARDQVDFVAAGDQAAEIYRLKPALAMSLPDTAGLVHGDKVQAARGYVAARPHLLLAAVLLLATIFLPFIDNGTESETCCVTVTSAHKLYGGLSDALDEQEQTYRGSVFGGSSMEEQIARQQQRNQGSGTRVFLKALAWLSYALWLLPVGAAAIIYRTIRHNRSRWLEFAIGLGGITAVLLIPASRWLFSHMNAGPVGFAMRQAADSLGYGFGTFIIGLAGLGLILTAFNRITKTPGL